MQTTSNTDHLGSSTEDLARDSLPVEVELKEIDDTIILEDDSNVKKEPIVKNTQISTNIKNLDAIYRKSFEDGPSLPFHDVSEYLQLAWSIW